MCVVSASRRMLQYPLIYEGDEASFRFKHNDDENEDLAPEADDVGGNDRGTNSGAEGGTNDRTDWDDDDEGGAHSKDARDGESDGDPGLGAEQGDGEEIDTVVGDGEGLGGSIVDTKIAPKQWKR